MRFKINAVLQVASTPFHQGVLALSWQYGSRTAVYDRASNSASATNLPHVRMDLSTTTMVELGVPFMAPTDFLLKESVDAYGTLSLNAILPVPSVVGMSPPTYKIMLFLTDMEFIGVYPNAVRSVNIQGGVEAEFESEAYPMSSALYSASKAANFIAKGVPSLSSIAGPPAWLLAKAAGALRSLGYSKPQVIQPPTRIFASGNVYEHSVDMPTTSIVLGPTAANHLAVTPQFACTDVDEMSLSYVTSLWSQLFVTTMKMTDAHDTHLWGATLSPSHMWFRAPSAAPYFNKPIPSVTTARNSFLPTHIMNAALYFNLWRGSFKFRFTVSKTKLHGGRLLVSYVPKPVFGATEANPITVIDVPESNSVGLQPTGHSAIFDLRDGNVFEFEVPFTGLAPWCRLHESIGSISLRVLDPLQGSAVVSSTVNILVEVAGVDFDFACPMGPLKVAHPAGTIVQGGLVSPTYKSEVSQYTVGEAITSFKQLIMMPSTVVTRMAPGSNNVDIKPWYYHPVLPTATGVAVIPETTSYTYGGNIAQCYLYAKGGTDLHVYHAQDSNSTYAGVVLTDAAERASQRTATTMPLIESHDGELHVRCPPYQAVTRIPIETHNVFGTVASGATKDNVWDPYFAANGAPTIRQTISYSAPSPYRPTMLPRLRLAYIGTGESTGYVIKRGAADDAALGHYMGPVPLAITTGAPVGFGSEIVSQFNRPPQPNPAPPPEEDPVIQGGADFPIEHPDDAIGAPGPQGPPGVNNDYASRATSFGIRNMSVSFNEVVFVSDDMLEALQFTTGDTPIGVSGSMINVTENGNSLIPLCFNYKPGQFRGFFLQTSTLDAFDEMIVPRVAMLRSYIEPNPPLGPSVVIQGGQDFPIEPDIPTGTPGPQGPQGPPGPKTDWKRVTLNIPSTAFPDMVARQVGSYINIWTTKCTIRGTCEPLSGVPLFNVYCEDPTYFVIPINMAHSPTEGRWNVDIQLVKLVSGSIARPPTAPVAVYGMGVTPTIELSP